VGLLTCSALSFSDIAAELSQPDAQLLPNFLRSEIDQFASAAGATVNGHGKKCAASEVAAVGTVQNAFSARP